jgi:hypothetical protein
MQREYTALLGKKARGGPAQSRRSRRQLLGTGQGGLSESLRLTFQEALDLNRIDALAAGDRLLRDYSLDMKQ